MNFYIVRFNEAGKIDAVLKHRTPTKYGLANWCIDIDARYDPREFAYTRLRDAARRIATLPKRLQTSKNVGIRQRTELFDDLGVEDWSKGY